MAKKQTGEKNNDSTNELSQEALEAKFSNDNESTEKENPKKSKN